MEISKYAKAVVNTLTVVVSVGTLILHETNGFLPTNVAHIVSVVVGVAGIAIHYLTPNTTTNPTVAATQSVRLKTKPRKRTPKVATKPA